jgi:pyrroline-5-carboxylate reductase
MGGALARAWREDRHVQIHDPNGEIPEGTEQLALLDPALVPEDAVVVLAVKPQAFAALAPQLAVLSGRLVVSIMAGIPLVTLSAALGIGSRVIRVMPNTPAAIGKGIAVAVAGHALTSADRAAASALLEAAGTLVWLEDEGDLDAVTAISGSGPAYFYRFTEALARAGAEIGLPEAIATQLARATFTGAAALAEQRLESLANLRAEVTSPGGTTAAGLSALDEDAAIDRLLGEVARRAAKRSRELSE